MMKISEVRDLKSEELHAELETKRRHLFDLRAQAVTEKLENPRRLTAVKRDIARILTVLRERGEESIENYQRHLEAVSHRK